MNRDDFNARAFAALRRTREEQRRSRVAEQLRVALLTAGAAGLLVLVGSAGEGLEPLPLFALAALVVCGGVALMVALWRIER